MDVNQELHGEGVLIRPMLVNGGFADARGGGDGVHAGGVDAAVGEELESGFHYFAVCLLAEAAGDGQVSGSNLDFGEAPSAEDEQDHSDAGKDEQVGCGAE